MSVEKAITGGTIMVEDAIKHAGYADPNFAPSRRSKVELIFVVPEGGDGKAFMEGVSRIADKKLTELLGKTPAALSEAPATAQAAEPVKETAAAKKARLAAEKAAEPGKTKADLEREMLAELEGNDVQTTTVVEPKDELADLLGDTAPTPVTDAELGKAAQEKNGKMKGVAGWAPEKIRELVGKFVLVDGKPKPGAKLQEIPAAQRHAFIEQLSALK